MAADGHQEVLPPDQSFPPPLPPPPPPPAVPPSETVPLEGGRWLLMGIRKSGPKAAAAVLPTDSEGTATPTTKSEEARSSSPPGSK